MTYLDGTEKPRGDAPPKICPLCGGELVTMWTGLISNAGRSVVASPRHVCHACQVTVRVVRMPSGSLHKTRKAARASVATEAEKRRRDLERRIRGLTNPA